MSGSRRIIIVSDSPYIEISFVRYKEKVVNV